MADQPKPPCDLPGLRLRVQAYLATLRPAADAAPLVALLHERELRAAAAAIAAGDEGLVVELFSAALFRHARAIRDATSEAVAQKAAAAMGGM